MTKHTPSESSIETPYTKKTLEQKGANKTALQKEIGWPMEPRRPMVCLPTGVTEALGGALLRETLPGILTLPVEILVLGKGSASYGSLFTELSKENDHRISIVKNEPDAMSKMYAAADIALFLSDASDLPEVKLCLAYGVVPIAPIPTDRTTGAVRLQDYDPVQETGNAFLYETPDSWRFFAALVRALETFKFPFDWRTIQRHCMEAVE